MRKAVLALALFVCACAPSLEKVSSDIKRDQSSGRLLKVAFIGQKESFCGPATLAMLLNYNGCSLTQDRIGEKYFSGAFAGLFTVDMIAAAKEYGFEVEQGPGDFDALKRAIDAGSPAIVLWNNLPEPLPAGHFALAVGYYHSKDGDWLVLHSGQKENLLMRRDQFEKLWKRENNWMMTVKPGPTICPSKRAAQ
jgi:ABC-type bacteriocin/lantibiotic exporter with double-glycine peptidase domain